MSLKPFRILLILTLITFLICPAFATDPYATELNPSWYIASGSNYLVYNSNTTVLPDLTGHGTFNYTCDPNRGMNINIQDIADGTHINYTFTLTSGHTVSGWIIQEGDPDWLHLGNHIISMDMNGTTTTFDTGVMILGKSQIGFFYHNNSGQIYLVMDSNEKIAMYMPYKDECIRSVTITSDQDVTYTIATFDLSAYANPQPAPNLFATIEDYFTLIMQLFEAILSIILILKVIFIDNFFMMIAFGELGILVISLRQNPKDVFGFLNDTLQYNVRFISFTVSLLSKFMEGFLTLVSIFYNIAKSIPIIGSFL